MTTQIPPAQTQPSSHVLQDPDEINLLEYAYVLIKNKWIIIGLAALGFVGGFIAAKIKGPTWKANAIIAPREAETTSSSPNLSSFGMLGGLVASQLSLGGNASLEKVETILDSKKFNAQMIRAYGLMPLLFADQWDSATGNWKEDFVPPQPLRAGAYLKSKFLEKETNKNNTMTITVSSPDSVVTDTVLASYLTFLDTYIRTSVQQDARENRAYLEKQLVGVTDPLLRAKIQELIAKEVEKMMVVSKEAFSVVDPPYISISFKEKKLYPIVFAFGLFFLACLGAVLGHAFTSADKTDEDKNLIQKMRGELFKLPWG